MFLYFADLTPEMVDEDPLLVLPCGHAFVTSTLDGLLEVKMYVPHLPGRVRRAHPWGGPSWTGHGRETSVSSASSSGALSAA